MSASTNGPRVRRILLGVWLGGSVLLVSGWAWGADPRAWEMEVGAGVGFAPDYEGSEDYEAVPQFYFRAKREHFFVELEGPALRANLVPHPVLKAGPVLRYRPERDDVETDRVDRLREVDPALELGGFVGVQWGKWDARVTLVQDVAGGHEGLLLTLGGGYTRPLTDRLTFGLTVSSTYASGDYMDSYFSIDADNAARSGLSTFDASSGFKDVGARVRLRYQMRAQWGILGTVGYTRLLADAADSPIVNNEGSANQMTGGVMVIYSF